MTKPNLFPSLNPPLTTIRRWPAYQSAVIRFTSNLVDQPSRMGVSSHFCKDAPDDLVQIQASGFTSLRNDFLWTQVEHKPGVYDFSAYDHLFADAQRRGMRPLLILGGGHPLYSHHRSADGSSYGLTKCSEIDAFTRFAVATLRHYRGQPIIWELWNESNHPLFWKPKPSVTEYIRLARQVLPAMRVADPSATLIAPCTSGSPVTYIRACIKAGLLQWADGVSIHPYQAFCPAPVVNRPPERAMTEIEAIRELLNHYGYSNKALLLSEWGYSTATDELDESTQAAWAARLYLLGLYYRSPMNIWYDWKEDGTDPANKEHHFGLVRPDRQLKPAYTSITTIMHQLKGFQFTSRLPVTKPEDHCWLFRDAHDRRRLVYWTELAPHKGRLPGLTSQTIVNWQVMPQVITPPPRAIVATDG